MKQFIGSTASVAYYNDFTNIEITNTHNIKIYLVPSKSTISDAIGELIWTKEFNGNSISTKYDSRNYEDFYNKHKDVNMNFRLFVNDECVHASKYVNKYLIEFDGDYKLTVEKFVDH